MKNYKKYRKGVPNYEKYKNHILTIVKPPTMNIKDYPIEYIVVFPLNEKGNQHFFNSNYEKTMLEDVNEDWFKSHLFELLK